MSVFDNYECEGQMSIFDILGPDSWSGKTSQEHSVQTKERTSDASLKKFAELRIKPPMYLCLKRADGQQADASWEMGGPLLGEFTMRSFGEFPSAENVSLLSQILEENPLPKYSLSAKACQGILNRAERRGKNLPEPLKQALIRQSASKNEPDVRGGVKESSSKTSEQHPSEHNAISQSCGINGETAGTLDVSYYKGCGERQGIERDVVCVGNGQLAQAKLSNKAGALNCMHDQQCVMVYGLDRASFNQGRNAKYDFSVEEEKAQTLVSRGPGGVLTKQSEHCAQEISKG